MSVSRKLIIVISLAAIAAASLLLIVAAVLRPFTVVAYRLGERDLAALREAASAFSASGGRAPRVVAAGRRSSLSSVVRGLGKPDLVVFAPGAESAAIATRFEPVPADRLGLVSRPILAALAAGEAAYGLPLAVDPLELAWNRAALAAAKLEPPADGAALGAACSALSPGSRGPLLVAGGDDATLVALVSQLVAERGGLPAYDALAEALAAAKSPAEAAGLAAYLGEIAAWDRAGWLPKGWLGFSGDTAVRYLKAGRPALAAELLSQRRSADYATISDYGSARLALGAARAGAPLAARVAAAAIPRKARHAKDAALLRDFLLSDKGQAILAKSMGAAPAASAAVAPDSIAYDARGRAQASERVLGGLAADSGTDPARLAAFIRSYLLEAGRK